jgi:hypothetical protein
MVLDSGERLDPLARTTETPSFAAVAAKTRSVDAVIWPTFHATQEKSSKLRMITAQQR